MSHSNDPITSFDPPSSLLSQQQQPPPRPKEEQGREGVLLQQQEQEEAGREEERQPPLVRRLLQDPLQQTSASAMEGREEGEATTTPPSVSVPGALSTSPPRPLFTTTTHTHHSSPPPSTRRPTTNIGTVATRTPPAPAHVSQSHANQDVNNNDNDNEEGEGEDAAEEQEEEDQDQLVGNVNEDDNADEDDGGNGKRRRPLTTTKQTTAKQTTAQKKKRKRKRRRRKRKRKEYNILFVGRHATGKTGLVKLLVDTSVLALALRRQRQRQRRTRRVVELPERVKRSGGDDESESGRERERERGGGTKSGSGGVIVGGEQGQHRRAHTHTRVHSRTSGDTVSSVVARGESGEEPQQSRSVEGQQSEEQEVEEESGEEDQESGEEEEESGEEDQDQDQDQDQEDEEERVRRVLAPLAEFASFTSVCPTTAVSTVHIPLAIPLSLPFPAQEEEEEEEDDDDEGEKTAGGGDDDEVKMEVESVAASGRGRGRGSRWRSIARGSASVRRKQTFRRRSRSEVVLVNLIDTPGLQPPPFPPFPPTSSHGDDNDGDRDGDREEQVRHALEGVLRVIMDGFEASRSTTSSSSTTTTEERSDRQIHLCLYLLDPEDVLPSYTRDLRHPPPSTTTTTTTTTALSRQRIHEAALGPGRHYDDDNDDDDDDNEDADRRLSPPIFPNVPMAMAPDDNEPISPLTRTRGQGQSQGRDGGGGFSTATLAEFDRRAIRALARYVPVLPIVAKADGVTIERLQAVREAIKRGIGVVAGNNEEEVQPFSICVPEAYHHGDGVLYRVGRGGTRRRTFEEYMERLKSSSIKQGEGEEEEKMEKEEKEEEEEVEEIEEGEVMDIVSAPLSAAASEKVVVSEPAQGETGEDKEEIITPGSKTSGALSAMDVESRSQSQRHSPMQTEEGNKRHERKIDHDQDSTFYRRDDLVRVYRWGSMDVLDPVHTDFVALRRFVFDRSNIERFRKVVSRDHLQTYLEDLARSEAQDRRRRSTITLQPGMTSPPMSITSTTTRSFPSASGPSSSSAVRILFDPLSSSSFPPPEHTPQPLPLHHISLVSPSVPPPSSSTQGRRESRGQEHPIRPAAESFPPQRSPPVPSQSQVSPLQIQQSRSGLGLQTRVLKLGPQGILSPEEDPPYGHGVPTRIPHPSSAAPAPPKHRTGRKIAVACNFCRSRKLKCDGGRPQCLQCQRRSMECEYETVIKKRGLGKTSSKATSVGASTKGASSAARVAGASAGDEGDRRRGSRGGEEEGSSSGGGKRIVAVPSGGSRPASSGGGGYGYSGTMHGSSRPAGQPFPHPGTQSAPSPSFSQPQPWHAYPPPGEHSSSYSVQPQGQPEDTTGTSGVPIELTTRGYACQFCKLRKTRCDGATPRCGNCERRNRHCVYPPFPPTPIAEEDGGGGRAGGRGEEGVEPPPLPPPQTRVAATSRQDRPGSRGRMSPLSDRPAGSGVMLPPISSLPLLGEHLPSSSNLPSPSAGVQTPSSASSAYWHTQSVKPPPPTLHTQLPPRQQHQPFSPVGTSRHGMHTGYSSTRGSGSGAAEEGSSSSGVPYSTRPTGRLSAVFPLPPPPPPHSSGPGSLSSPTSTSISFPLIGRRSEPSVDPSLSRRSSGPETFWRQGDSPGVSGTASSGSIGPSRHESFGEQSRRPGTAESQTFTSVWRDRGSFSSSSTRGGGGGDGSGRPRSGSTAGGARKRKASQSDEEFREEVRWNYVPGGSEAPQMPSPPKRRKVSSDAASESFSQPEESGGNPERRSEHRRDWESSRR